MRSIVGSMSWVIRACRPDMAYAVSRLQTKKRKPKVRDLIEANKTLKKMQTNHDAKMCYKAADVDWDKASIYVVSDASYAGEEGVLGGDALEPHRSQA